MTVLVAGEALVDFIPDAPGALADVESFDRRAGGSTANVAVGLARLGRAPRFWTRVGADPFGDFLEATLEREGVDTGLLERDTEARTALVFVSHDAAGDRAFAPYRDGTADTRLSPGSVDDATLADCEWVHVGGVTLADEPARSATYDLAERAAAAGCTVSFDPNARPGFWEAFEFGPSVERMLGTVDVVVASREDLAAAGLQREDPAALADAVLEHGPHTAFVTLGADGAVARARSAAPWGPAGATHRGFDVAVADATGAGDAFAAGAIDALLDGRSLGGTVAFANAVGAAATTGLGAMAALPDRETAAAMARDDPGERI